jgi:hypothetical protein
MTLTEATTLAWQATSFFSGKSAMFASVVSKKTMFLRQEQKKH